MLTASQHDKPNVSTVRVCILQNASKTLKGKGKDFPLQASSKQDSTRGNKV
jgi:hypothetical protein